MSSLQQQFARRRWLSKCTWRTLHPSNPLPRSTLTSREKFPMGHNCTPQRQPTSGVTTTPGTRPNFRTARWTLPNPTHQNPTTPHGQGGGSGAPYSNRIKTNHNLWYCFSCCYNVNYMGHQCPNTKPGRISNVLRDESHLVPGSSMKAQHQILPDDTGAGKGWIQAQSLNKSFYGMGKQGQ